MGKGHSHRSDRPSPAYPKARQEAHCLHHLAGPPVSLAQPGYVPLRNTSSSSPGSLQNLSLTHSPRWQRETCIAWPLELIFLNIGLNDGCTCGSVSELGGGPNSRPRTSPYFCCEAPGGGGCGDGLNSPFHGGFGNPCALSKLWHSDGFACRLPSPRSGLSCGSSPCLRL